MSIVPDETHTDKNHHTSQGVVTCWADSMKESVLNNIGELKYIDCTLYRRCTILSELYLVKKKKIKKT